jgi:hypothetical protein
MRPSWRVNPWRGQSPKEHSLTLGPSLRSYQMPVRDEESESQRKARSRLMRQSRRSTQVWGVGWAGLGFGSEGGGLGPGPLGVREESWGLDPWV